ncbi:MAG: hypothetical protein BWY82_00788 [Verrucomicrobia bacterium ADurb.Bin474]|nr:MAG: hypothetical protein BWY82_00788 [Verrucomicrobia bacterium ADurb.Bin474]
MDLCLLDGPVVDRFCLLLDGVHDNGFYGIVFEAVGAPIAGFVLKFIPGEPREFQFQGVPAIVSERMGDEAQQVRKADYRGSDRFCCSGAVEWRQKGVRRRGGDLKDAGGFVINPRIMRKFGFAIEAGWVVRRPGVLYYLQKWSVLLMII